MLIFRLLFFGVFGCIMVNNCCAMDVSVAAKKPEAIVIDNGLLTIVPGIVAKTEYKWLSGDRKITGKRFVQDHLINLIAYQACLASTNRDLHYNERVAYPARENVDAYEVFCPIVFKVDSLRLENLGQFNKKEHRELKEALRQNKALYYTYGRGAFIYSTEARPKENICAIFNKELDIAEQETIKLFF